MWPLGLKHVERDMIRHSINATTFSASTGSRTARVVGQGVEQKAAVALQGLLELVWARDGLRMNIRNCSTKYKSIIKT